MRPRWRRMARRLIGEPLFQFALIGVVLAVAAHAYQRSHDTYRIVVTPGWVAQIARKYDLQFGSPPDPATLAQLVSDDVHDEILFRQGLALRLDRGDEIVRRRIVQKAQILLQNGQAPPEPTPAQLQAYYDTHADRYRVAPRASFTHVYFARDNGGDAAALARAKAALARLSPGVTRAPGLGDPFPDLYDFSGFEPEQATRLFGRTPFAAAPFTAPIGRWSGPFRSAYGWHLLYVSARSPARRPPLSEVADQVRADAMRDGQDRADQAAFDRVAQRYTVVRADRGAAR